MPSRTTGRATATLTSNRIGCLSIEWIRILSALSAPAAGCNGMPSPLQSYAAAWRRQRCKVIWAPVSDEFRQSATGKILSFPKRRFRSRSMPGASNILASPRKIAVCGGRTDRTIQRPWTKDLFGKRSRSDRASLCGRKIPRGDRLHSYPRDVHPSQPE